ncbi:MAG: TetR/AcrR family transcriptional regulator [Ilumatobacter fluminis]|uniref:TetR/AcrR family transcriptional regulator n=1 Tax=Ilumatobacter fluminis TaxID=467091 RepID=UPI0032EE05BD
MVAPAEPLPTELSPKARRTRASLVDAATEVFAKQQYLGTNVADIVSRAGVSHGTFYTYFDSKEDIFREVGLEMQRRFLAVRDEVPGPDEATLLERVEATNRSYLCVYQKNADLFAVIEQGATFNEELRKIRLEIRNGFVDRSEQAIARFQREGLVYDDLDARYVANALGSMVDRFAYVWLVLGEEFELEEAVRTLTLLWARALGVEAPPGTMPRKRKRRKRS